MPTTTFIPLGDVRLTDRTRTVTDWTCQRERFYLTEFGGTGIVSVKGKTELDFGTDIHDSLAELATRLGQPDVVGELARRTAAKVREREIGPCGPAIAGQLAAVGEGLLRGYWKAVWPALLQSYDIVAVEQEVQKRLTPSLTFMARPDLILRSKADGTYWYWEYKTSGQRPEDWLKQWPKAVQVHSAILATEETLGLKLAGCIVQGLYKGYKARDKSGENLRSPFCEGWRWLGGARVEYSYTYMRAKGWERFAPADSFDGGTAAWVEAMPADMLSEQFPRTPPIFLRRDLADRFFSQLVEREKEINNAVHAIKLLSGDYEHMTQEQVEDSIQSIMDRAFPMAFSQCTGRYGKYDCPMLEACWNPTVNADPIRSGLYKRREPHHTPEIAMFKEKGLL